jgi:uncharacterized protein DUF6600/FecR-like protein
MNTSGDREIGRSENRELVSAVLGSKGETFKLLLSRLALVALAIICFASLANADDEEYSRSTGSQPDVARVSLIHGDVSMQRGDSGDWATATINTPLLRGDAVATGDKSRTEVQLDYANILRLSSSSQAKIADLTRSRIQIQLAQGYANYTQFKGSEAEVEIDTPNVAVRPLRAGRYRVQVNSDFETDVIVRSGEVEISTPEGSTTVKEGHVALIRGADNPEYKVENAPGKDDWDHWNKDRDDVIRDSQSYRRTNAYYTGAHDLDGYGRWVYVPGYGSVWQPYEQSVGWAPYQSGRWVWEPYWGWTWVSYEPWGWAPYHYGRWFLWQSSWVWWPGPVYTAYRPVWAPAFVSFIGFGNHTSFAFGFGSIGWIPIGPHDYFYPWYGRGFNRVNVVNITNITTVNNVYGVRPLAVRGRQPYFSNVDMALKNPRVRGAISGVPAEQFGRGNMQVRRLDVKDGDLRQSRVMTGNLPVVPTRESLRPGGNAPQRMTVQPKQVDRFYSRRQPPAGPPSFNDQASRMQQVVQAHTQPGMVNRTDSPARMGNTQVPARNNAPSVTQPAPGRPSGIDRMPSSAQNQGRGGWGRFGGNDRPGSATQSRPSTDTMTSRPGNVQVPKQGNAPGTDARDRSWTRFGGPGSGRGNQPGNTQNAQQPSRSPDSFGRGTERFPSRTDRPQQSTPAPTTRSGENGGWSRFPSGSDRSPRTDANINRNDRVDSASRPSSKPRLDFDKPIVTPRSTPAVRMDPRREPSPSSSPRMPEMRNEPRYSPPASRTPEARGGYSGGGYSAPRNMPSRSEGGSARGGNRSGGNNSGGGDKGSKSSSRNR